MGSSGAELQYVIPISIRDSTTVHAGATVELASHEEAGPRVDNVPKHGISQEQSSGDIGEVLGK